MRAAYDQLGISPPKRSKKKGKPSQEKPSQEKKHETKKRKTSGTGASSMAKQMAELIVPGCKTIALDRMYENPPLSGLPQCDCSDCTPGPELGTGKRPPRQRAKGEARHLTKEVRESVTKRFVALRRKIFAKEARSALTDPFFTLPRVLPNELISNIIDALPQLSMDDLSALVSHDRIAKIHIAEIWTVAVELRVTHEQQLKQKAAPKVYVLSSHRTLVCL